MNIVSILQKYHLDCLSLLQWSCEPGRQNKAPACSRSRRQGGSGERRNSCAGDSGQAPGFSALLTSKRCTFLHCVIPYMKNKKREKKTKVKSKDQQAKFNPFPTAAQQLTEVTAKRAGVLLRLMLCACREELRKASTVSTRGEWYCKPPRRHAWVLKPLVASNQSCLEE